MLWLWNACVQFVGLIHFELRQINVGTLTPSTSLKSICERFRILLHLLVLELLKAELGQVSCFLSRKVLCLVHQ